MHWFEPFLRWVEANRQILWWSFAASVALVLLTPAAVAYAVLQLPEDYFLEKKRPHDGLPKRHPVVQLVIIIAKNAVGLVFLMAGVTMLFVPGQGLLTIAVALMLLDFPGKYRAERWLATRPAIWRSLNWLRKCAGRKPMWKPPA